MQHHSDATIRLGRAAEHLRRAAQVLRKFPDGEMAALEVEKLANKLLDHAIEGSPVIQ